MRCSICGAKLKKEGDICTNCYKAYQEEEDLKKDVNVRLKLKRKYSIPYEISRYAELILIFILATIGCFALKNILEGFLCLLLLIVLIGILMFLDKRIANSTKAVFYDKKVEYTFKFLFFDTHKMVKYSDLKDVTYYQTHRQKKYGYGDLCVYAKGSIPGATLLNGFQIKNVENVKEVLEEIGKIVGPIEN
jgi:hypothetical protein